MKNSEPSNAVIRFLTEVNADNNSCSRNNIDLARFELQTFCEKMLRLNHSTNKLTQIKCRKKEQISVTANRKTSKVHTQTLKYKESDVDSNIVLSSHRY